MIGDTFGLCGGCGKQKHMSMQSASGAASRILDLSHPYESIIRKEDRTGRYETNNNCSKQHFGVEFAVQVRENHLVVINYYFCRWKRNKHSKSFSNKQIFFL